MLAVKRVVPGGVPGSLLLNDESFECQRWKNDGNLVRLEYAMQNFDIPLILVIRLQQCRFVQAALEGEKVSKYLPSMVNGLESAIEATQGKSVNAVCKMHTRLGKEDIFGFSEVFREKVSNKSLQIVAGFYCSDTGIMGWKD